MALTVRNWLLILQSNCAVPSGPRCPLPGLRGQGVPGPSGTPKVNNVRPVCGPFPHATFSAFNRVFNFWHLRLNSIWDCAWIEAALFQVQHSAQSGARTAVRSQPAAKVNKPSTYQTKHPSDTDPHPRYRRAGISSPTINQHHAPPNLPSYSVHAGTKCPATHKPSYKSRPCRRPGPAEARRPPKRAVHLFRPADTLLPPQPAKAASSRAP